jgi:hypothetical protein
MITLSFEKQTQNLFHFCHIQFAYKRNSILNTTSNTKRLYYIVQILSKNT